MIRMNRPAICLSIAGLLLAACGSEPDPGAAAATAQPAQAAADDPMARMARAVGNGKPGAAVQIRYDFASKPAVGTPTELQIAFVPNAGVDALEVVVSGMEGVTLAGTLSASFTDVEPSKPYLHTVSVLSWLPSTGSGLCRLLHPASPMSCASRSRGTSVVFRRPLHGHVHVSAQHDRWIKLRWCRSVTVAQSVWVCLVAFSSQYSCSLFVHAHLSTPLHACS
jgi:hypothetical protein